MPVYNEEGAIVAAVDEVREHVLALIPESELVVVDDGSRDSTGRLLDDLSAADTRIAVIHQANGGHGAALLTGLNAARGDYVFLIDSDRQIPLGQLQVGVGGGHGGARCGVRRAAATLRSGAPAVFVAGDSALGQRAVSHQAPATRTHRTSCSGAASGTRRAIVSPTARWHRHCSSPSSRRGAATTSSRST